MTGEDRINVQRYYRSVLRIEQIGPRIVTASFLDSGLHSYKRGTGTVARPRDPARGSLSCGATLQSSQQLQVGKETPPMDENKVKLITVTMRLGMSLIPHDQ